MARASPMGKEVPRVRQCGTYNPAGRRGGDNRCEQATAARASTEGETGVGALGEAPMVGKRLIQHDEAVAIPSVPSSFPRPHNQSLRAARPAHRLASHPFADRSTRLYPRFAGIQPARPQCPSSWPRRPTYARRLPPVCRPSTDSHDASQPPVSTTRLRQIATDVCHARRLAASGAVC